ncbi:hypothetical protein CTA2_2581 [Colletotrichum tanaceti]|uniref:Uncharacterized protein n=1 Tax=Colletotrichum tanaceti TaxID=1306861 RepID=A0A4U6XVK4_9PEZI|nr:hypothetical protein CTA2_2581 [Colletotrichum tanaceti]TKW60070.1 hypothetical protein CTA1_3113 [Colletotrichum tanaceti]
MRNNSPVPLPLPHPRVFPLLHTHTRGQPPSRKARKTRSHRFLPYQLSTNTSRTILQQFTMIEPELRRKLARAGELLNEISMGMSVTVKEYEWLEDMRKHIQPAFIIPADVIGHFPLSLDHRAQKRQYASTLIAKLVDGTGLSVAEEMWFCVAQHEQPEIIRGMQSSCSSAVDGDEGTPVQGDGRNGRIRDGGSSRSLRNENNYSAMPTPISQFSLPTDPGRVLELAGGGGRIQEALRRDFLYQTQSILRDQQQQQQQQQGRPSMSALDPGGPSLSKALDIFPRMPNQSSSRLPGGERLSSKKRKDAEVALRVAQEMFDGLYNEFCRIMPNVVRAFELDASLRRQQVIIQRLKDKVDGDDGVDGGGDVGNGAGYDVSDPPPPQHR